MMQEDMEEKKPSISSLSLGAPQCTTTTTSSLAKYSLVFVVNAPTFIFPDKTFPIEVQLVSNATSAPVATSLSLHVELCDPYGRPLERHQQEWLEISSSAQFQNKPNTTLHLRLLRKGLHQTFTLRLSCPTSQVVDPVTSATTIVGTHCLRIAHHPKDTFYKDGPRSGCLSLTVRLINEFGKTVSNCRLPIRLALVYADDLTEVIGQSILEVFNEGSSHHKKRLSLQDDGTLTLRYRINHVSKNHRNRDFAMRVEARPHQSFVSLGAIGSAVSIGTRVLSKMPTGKRKRTNGHQRCHVDSAPSPSPMIINRLDFLEEKMMHLTTEVATVKETCLEIRNLLTNINNKLDERSHEVMQPQFVHFECEPRSPIGALKRPQLLSPRVSIPSLDLPQVYDPATMLRTPSAEPTPMEFKFTAGPPLY